MTIGAINLPMGRSDASRRELLNVPIHAVIALVPLARDMGGYRNRRCRTIFWWPLVRTRSYLRVRMHHNDGYRMGLSML